MFSQIKNILFVEFDIDKIDLGIFGKILFIMAMATIQEDVNKLKFRRSSCFETIAYIILVSIQ